MDDAQYIEAVEAKLKARVRESWSPSEHREIQARGEMEADFYHIWFKLCKLDSMRRWVSKYRKLTRNDKRILREYDERAL